MFEGDTGWPQYNNVADLTEFKNEINKKDNKQTVKNIVNKKLTVTDKPINYDEIFSPEDIVGHPEMINHPKHYGGEENPYEAIKIIEALNLNFNLGNCLKYICRLGKKPSGSLSNDEKTLEDLKKAAWYMQREVERFQKELEEKKKQCYLKPKI